MGAPNFPGGESPFTIFGQRAIMPSSIGKVRPDGTIEDGRRELKADAAPTPAPVAAPVAPVLAKSAGAGKKGKASTIAGGRSGRGKSGLLRQTETTGTINLLGG